MMCSRNEYIVKYTCVQNQWISVSSPGKKCIPVSFDTQYKFIFIISYVNYSKIKWAIHEVYRSPIVGCQLLRVDTDRKTCHITISNDIFVGLNLKT